MNPTQVILRAAMFSADKHRNQRRKDAEASPYINHPLALATLLAEAGGIDDVEVLCAALLHDTLEDTECSAAELEAQFGARVSALVAEVTDDKSLPKATRKALAIEKAPKLSAEAKWLKLADLACNVRDIGATPPSSWDRARREAYVDWAERVAAGLRGSHPGLEAHFTACVAESRRQIAAGLLAAS